DRGATLALQQVLRQPLRAFVQRQHEVVAGDRRAAEPVAEGVEDRAEALVRRRQVRVLLAFEAGARAALRRVADRLRREAVRRVDAEVERLASDLAADVRGEHGVAVGGEDQAALDLKLCDALDLVVLARRESAGSPRLPVRRRHDERGEHEEREQRDAGDLFVHVWELARSETRRSPASTRKLATTDEPPYEMNGSVIPVSGMIRSTPPTMMKVCRAKPNVRPAASSFEKPSSTCSAVFIPRATKSMNTRSSADAPIRPSSCASADQMKSVLIYGISCVPPGVVKVPFPSPVPSQPPLAIE